MAKFTRSARMLGAGGLAAVIMAVGGSVLPASGQVYPHPSSVAPTRGTAPVPMVTGSQPMNMGGGSDPGNAALTADIAAARVATAKYATNLSRAKADGYQIITKMMPNMGFHFMNAKITGFNVRKPQILVYEHTGSKWQLGALEWVFLKMPKNPPLPNATFGSFPAACHYADGTFIPDQNAKTCKKKAPSGAKFTFWHPDLITMHVWAWYPNPAGLYSSTNPLITPFNGN
jgi:hypothetical protein